MDEVCGGVDGWTEEEKKRLKGLEKGLGGVLRGGVDARKRSLRTLALNRGESLMGVVDGWRGGVEDGWRGGVVDGWRGGVEDGWRGGVVDGWRGGVEDG